jgi:hypothetical protein
MAYWTQIYESGGLANAIFIAVTYPYVWMVFTGHTSVFTELIYLTLMLLPLLRFRVHPGRNAKGPISVSPRSHTVRPQRTDPLRSD